MKLTFILLSALLITWIPCQSATLNDRFNLEVNQEAVNCVNAKKLMNAANADSTRLSVLTSGLRSGLSILASIHDSLDQACRNVNSHHGEISLIQASPIDRNSLPALQQKLHDNFVNLGLHREFMKNLGSTLSTLSEVSDRSSGSAEDTRLRCEEGNTKLNRFDSEVNQMLLSIQNEYLDIFLSTRYDEIDQVLDQCPITQTGLIAKSYLGSGNEFEQRVPRARFQDYKIQFDQPFAEVPHVAVSLTGFDLDTELPAVAALVPEVSESGFTLRIHLVPYARLYSVQVSYLATLPTESGIFPKLHMVDYEHDKDFSQLAESVGPRFVEREISLPREFETANVGVVTFLNGFSFGGGADPRLKVAVTKVSPQTFTLRYSTSGSTRFLSAVTYNLIYKTSGRINSGATEIAPTKDSAFYVGFGPRREEMESFTLRNLGKKPEVFSGLYAFDFSAGYGYRVSEDLTVEQGEEETNAKLAFNTIGDTKINMVKSSVFYTCNSRLC